MIARYAGEERKLKSRCDGYFGGRLKVKLLPTGYVHSHNFLLAVLLLEPMNEAWTVHHYH